MSSPVTTDDLVQGAVKWLADFDDVVAALGYYPETETPYLFQHKLWVRVEGSQSTAAVITQAGGWSVANDHNSLRFPRLGLEIYADPLRDAAANITEPGEAQRRIHETWTVFDAHLHRPADKQQYWGDVRIIGSVRLTEPTVYEVPDGDGVLRLQSFYAITQG